MFKFLSPIILLISFCLLSCDVVRSVKQPQLSKVGTNTPKEFKQNACQLPDSSKTFSCSTDATELCIEETKTCNPNISQLSTTEKKEMNTCR